MVEIVFPAIHHHSIFLRLTDTIDGLPNPMKFTLWIGTFYRFLLIIKLWIVRHSKATIFLIFIIRRIINEHRFPLNDAIHVIPAMKPHRYRIVDNHQLLNAIEIQIPEEVRRKNRERFSIDSVFMIEHNKAPPSSLQN